MSKETKQIPDMDEAELFDKFLELHEDNVVMLSPTRISWVKTKKRIRDRAVDYCAWLYHWRMIKKNPLDRRSCAMNACEWVISEEKRLRKTIAERRKELSE